MFLDRVGNHPRCNILFDPSHFVLQQLDYLEYIDLYHERIKMFHVKDAEFRPTGRQGVYGGYQSWIDRAGRFRSLGDGQVDFAAIFSKLTQYDFPGWAVLEWECCIKSAEQGAAEGAPFIARHIIQAASTTFDDFASLRRRPSRQSPHARPRTSVSCSPGSVASVVHPGARPARAIEAAADRASAILRTLPSRRHIAAEQLQRGKHMTIDASTTSSSNRRLRLGMVGGGPGGFIGAVHRIAARIDDRFELVAAALSSDPEREPQSRARSAHRAGPRLRQLHRNGRR